MQTRVSVELQLEVERLFSIEAHLLDERRFEEWLALFTDDATYAVSMREAVEHRQESDPLYRYPETPLLDEDHAFTAMRVKRLETRLAHAEQPPSLTRHLVTNVLIHENLGDGLHVSSHFQVYQNRPGGSERVFHGRRDDLLRRVDGQWKIARRQVVLDTTLLPSTITVFF